MKTLLLFTSLIFSSLAGADASFEGYVQVASGHDVYVSYLAPKPGKPTVVLVNGLVYNLKRWEPYVKDLEKEGVGVVRYYFRGQLRTLLREITQIRTPAFFKTGLTYADLSNELIEVLDALEITQKVNVVGLSYGSSIAAEFAEQNPERVDNLIFMAPMVISLDNYDPTGAWIRLNLEAIRAFWGPLWGPVAYESYYNLIYRSYLVDQRLTPDRVPPELKNHPDEYKESVFHQVRAVRDFDLREYDFKKIGRVHLMIADGEEDLAYADQVESWNAWRKQNLGGLVYIEGSSHAIPDDVPHLAASLTVKMLGQGKAFRDGQPSKVSKGKLVSCSGPDVRKTCGRI